MKFLIDSSVFLSCVFLFNVELIYEKYNDINIYIFINFFFCYYSNIYNIILHTDFIMYITAYIKIN